MKAHSAQTKSVSLIENGTIVTPHRVIERGSILIHDGQIVEIGEAADIFSHESSSSGRIDAENKFVIPGMIDIHTHGLEGGSVFDCSAKSINKMATSFPRHGITSFLPTTGAESQQMLLQTAQAIAQLMETYAPSEGAEILGMNLEGPFLSKTKPGAQPLVFIRDPNWEEFSQIYDESRKTVRLVTIAPELKGALELIKKITAKGITVAAGHSNATYEEMTAGIDAGITHASHMFNAMREFRHRDPGMVAAILLQDRVTAELIADNIHVHEATMKLLLKTKGVKNLVAVSDSMPLAGMPDGNYNMTGFKIQLKNGAVTLPNGQLAGSAVTLDRSIGLLTNQLHVPLRDAVKMTTINPARVIGAEKRKGSIEEGKDADLVLLDKSDLSVRQTIIKGQLIYG